MLSNYINLYIFYFFLRDGGFWWVVFWFDIVVDYGFNKFVVWSVIGIIKLDYYFWILFVVVD